MTLDLPSLYEDLYEIGTHPDDVCYLQTLANVGHVYRRAVARGRDDPAASVAWVFWMQAFVRDAGGSGLGPTVGKSIRGDSAEVVARRAAFEAADLTPYPGAWPYGVFLRAATVLAGIFPAVENGGDGCNDAAAEWIARRRRETEGLRPSTRSS